MASAPGGVIITAAREAVVEFWSKNKPPVEYFWLHRLFSNILSSNSSAIKDAFEPRTAPSADPFHCLGTDPPKVASDLPMFKVKSCKKELREEVFKQIHDRFGEYQQQ